MTLDRNVYIHISAAIWMSLLIYGMVQIHNQFNHSQWAKVNDEKRKCIKTIAKNDFLEELFLLHNYEVLFSRFTEYIKG